MFTNTSAPTCTCTNGAAAPWPRCTQDKLEMCTLCKAGYGMESSNKTCVRSPSCTFGFVLNPSKTKCVKPGCAFDSEVGLCQGWTESGLNLWTRGTSTPSRGTGAQMAHTGKYFMYLETTIGIAGEASYLQSSVLPSGTRSMSFFYNMYGSG
eukprot:COSAG01_NODE_5420_length_4274_cov_2.472096_1_plen_151_part_10